MNDQHLKFENLLLTMEWQHTSNGVSSFFTKEEDRFNYMLYKENSHSLVLGCEYNGYTTNNHIFIMLEQSENSIYETIADFMGRQRKVLKERKSKDLEN